VLGYALLGAGWLVLKSEGTLRSWAYARIPWLVGAVFIALGLAFFVSVTIDADAIAQSNLRDRHWGFVFPILAVAALEHFPFSVNRRDSHWAANKIQWSSHAEEAGNGVFERFTSSSDPGC